MNLHQFQSLELIRLMESHSHTAHIHENNFRLKIHYFHEYEFHCHEFPVNINLKAMNVIWI